MNDRLHFRAPDGSELIRLQREATIARQEAAESAEAYAIARDENTDLIAQLTDSNDAYDRMAEQLERTAQDLQALLSGAVSVAVADAQKRASAAEKEVAALRAQLSSAKASFRSRSQSPDRRHHAQSPSSSPTSVGSPVHSQNSTAVQHLREELLNTAKESSQLQKCIRRQAHDITALQHALFEERAKAKTALSMCNTAHCNHVRSLVARVESTVIPVSRLADSIQRLSAPFAASSPTFDANLTLRRVLESKEWTMEDWDSVEEAAILWLEELQSTVGACAEAVERSHLQTPNLKDQITTLTARLQQAEASAAAAREGEAAATAREARAQEEAAAAASALRSLRAVMDNARALNQPYVVSIEAMDATIAREHMAAAEERAIAAEAARALAEAQAEKIDKDLRRLQALHGSTDQQAADASTGAAPAAQEGPLKGQAHGPLSHPDCAAYECHEPASLQVGPASATPELEIRGVNIEVDNTLGLRDDLAGSSDPVGTSSAVGEMPADSSSMATPMPALDAAIWKMRQIGCAGTAEELAPHVDDAHVLAEVLQQQQALTEYMQEEEAMMVKAIQAKRTLQTAVSMVEGACTQACHAVRDPVMGIEQQTSSSIEERAQQDVGGVWSDVWGALKELHAADEVQGKLMEQLQKLQQERQRCGGQAISAAHVGWSTVLHKLESSKQDALERLADADEAQGDGLALDDDAGGDNPESDTIRHQRMAAVEAQLVAVQEECASLQAAALTAERALNGARAVEAELAAAQEECSVLKSAAATAASALEAAQDAAREKEEQRVAAERAAESATAAAAASSQSMGEDAARMRSEIERLTEEAQKAAARETTAQEDAETVRQQLLQATNRAAAAEAQASAAEEQIGEYKRRCSTLSKACLVAEVRADDCESAMPHVEEVRQNVLRAQQAAMTTVEALQRCTRKVAVAASQRASKAEATMADVEQIWAVAASDAGAAYVSPAAGTVGQDGAQTGAKQELWLPALLDQMRDLRAAVDEWLTKLDSAEATTGPAVSLRQSARSAHGESAHSCKAMQTHSEIQDVNAAGAALATLLTPTRDFQPREAHVDVVNGNVEQHRIHRSNQGDGQPQSTLDALLSSARELSMLETALQNPAATCSTQGEAYPSSMPPYELKPTSLGPHTKTAGSSLGASGPTQDSPAGSIHSSAVSSAPPRSIGSPDGPAASTDATANNGAIWREITARHSTTGTHERVAAGQLQRPLEAEQGLRRALSRFEAAMGTGVEEGSECSTTGAAEALEDLQMHVMHVERFRALSEEVIVRAKERILAHAREQELDVPVTVTQRDSVAVEDVATMLDRVLINSSNNADRLADTREAAEAAEAETATLRAQLAESRAEANKDAKLWSARLDTAREELQGAEEAGRAAAAEAAALAARLEAVEEQCKRAEADVSARIVELDQLQVRLADAQTVTEAADARVEELETALESMSAKATASQEVAESQARVYEQRLEAATQELADSTREELQAAEHSRDNAMADLEQLRSELVEFERSRSDLESQLHAATGQRAQAFAAAEATAGELQDCRTALASERASTEVLRSALIALQERMTADGDSSRSSMAQLQQDLTAVKAEADALGLDAATRALEAAAAAEAASAAEEARKAAQQELQKLQQDALASDQREVDLLQQIQQLQGTVNELTAVLKALQQQEVPAGALEIQKSLDVISAQAAGLQAQLGQAQEAISSSKQQLAAAAGREAALQGATATAEQERDAAAAQVEQLRVQVRGLEGDCKALQSTVEELQEACEVQAAARAVAEQHSALAADVALQTLQSSLEQELQKAAKRTAEEQQRLQQAADAAAEQVQHLTAVSATDADKISALRATLLYQEAKYQRIVAIHVRIASAAYEQGQKLKEITGTRDVKQSPESPQIQAFTSLAAQSRQGVSEDREGEGPSDTEQRLQDALKKAGYAEAELEVVRREQENERSVVQQLLADAGTLQAQLDALQTNSATEEGSRNLAEEVQHLQEAVRLANTDLHLAEAHAVEMQTRLEQKDRERAELQVLLQQQLTSLLGAQTVLEEQFEEMREERDQALSDLQLLSDQCSELLNEQGRIFMQAPSDSEQVKWLRNKNVGLQRQLAEVLKDVDLLERRVMTLSK